MIKYRISRLEKLIRLLVGTKGTGVLNLSHDDFERFIQQHPYDPGIVKGGGGHLVIPQTMSEEKWIEESKFYYDHIADFQPKDWID